MRRHGERDHDRDRNDRAVGELLKIIICKLEVIQAKVEQRPSKLSPKDQELADKIFEIEAGDIRKIDDVLSNK